MAGTMVSTYDQVPNGIGSLVNKVTVAWTSDASGVVSGNIKNRSGAADATFRGFLQRVVFNPDDTDAPTDNYDVTITDEDGIDILGGLGANRDTANSEEKLPGVVIDDGTVLPAEAAPRLVKRAINGKLTLAIANAGNAKKGKIHLYLDDNA